MHDYLPWQVGVPLAIILWAMWFWVTFGGTRHVNEFFAHRRAVRRMRRMYDVNTTLPPELYKPTSRKMNYNASRRRR